MKTSKILFILATLLCSTGLTACGDGISSSFEDFGALCKASGGDVVEEKDNVCKCDKECATGVVCIAGKCANDIIEVNCERTECKNNDDGSGSLFVCVEGRVSEEIKCSGFSCKNDKECGECKNDAKKCNANGEYICINGDWGEPNKCGDLGCNKKATACAVCNNNETQCNKEASKKQICNGGEWLFDKECEYGCLNEKCAECSGNTRQCTDLKKVSECQQGKWVEIEDCNDKYCSNGTCTTEIICNIGELICDGHELKKCDDTKKWVLKENCEERDCLGYLKQCACDESLRECKNDNNKIGQMTVCVEGENTGFSCEDVSCNNDGTDCGQCKNDDTICAGEKIRTCANGVWETPADCGSGEKCDAETGKCSSTKPVGPDEKCSDNIQQVCVNNDKYLGTKYKYDGGKVTFTEDCKNIDGEKVSCAGNECGECKNDDTKCKTNVSNNGEYTYIKFTCDKGKWSKEQNCEQGYECNQTNTDCVKKSSGNCPGNVPYCESNNVLAYCDDNGNLQKKICDSILHCYGSEGNAYCGECENGSKTCVENTKKLCENGKWNEITCPNGCSSDGECAPQNACTDGEYTCENNKLCECKDKNWIPTEKREICIDNNSGTHAYKCDGENLIDNDCGQNSCKENVCGECKNGENNCENGFSYSCQNGDWNRILSKQCKNGCDEAFGSCSEELKEGLQCYSEFPDKCDSNKNIYSCVNGKLENKGMCYDKDNVGQYCPAGTVIDCIDNVSCNSFGSDCGDCLNGTVCKIENSGALSTAKYKKCDNGVYKDCSYSGSGDISASISCGESETADYPKCPQ